MDISYPNVPQTSRRGTRTTPTGWGVVYKVALGLVAVGVLTIVLSPFVGVFLHNLVIVPLLEFQGVAGYGYEPETGAEVLALFGVCYVIAGICMFLVRLVFDLLELAGGPVLTHGMRPRSKLALGTAAAGTVVFAAAIFPMVLLSLLFVDYESAVTGVMSALVAVLRTGILLLACSLMTLFLHGTPFGWADVGGWAKLRCGWINRLAVALVVVGLIGSIPFLPFDEVAAVFAVTGVAVLVLGILPQLLAERRP